MRKPHGRIAVGLFCSSLIPAMPTRFAPSISKIWCMGYFWEIAGTLNDTFIRANCDALIALIP
jgi:hypothetical protein